MSGMERNYQFLKNRWKIMLRAMGLDLSRDTRAK